VLRKGDVVMESTTFGRASFLDWTVSGCAMDGRYSHSHVIVAVVFVFGASCLLSSHERFLTVVV
jgi:hypothetical protein